MLEPILSSVYCLFRTQIEGTNVHISYMLLAHLAHLVNFSTPPGWDKCYSCAGLSPPPRQSLGQVLSFFFPNGTGMVYFLQSPSLAL